MLCFQNVRQYHNLLLPRCSHPRIWDSYCALGMGGVKWSNPVHFISIVSSTNLLNPFPSSHYISSILYDDSANVLKSGVIQILLFLFNFLFFAYIPNDFPFPSSLLPINTISPLPSTHSPINPSHFYVLVIPYNAASSLSRMRALSSFLGMIWYVSCVFGIQIFCANITYQWLHTMCVLFWMSYVT